MNEDGLRTGPVKAFVDSFMTRVYKDGGAEPMRTSMDWDEVEAALYAIAAMGAAHAALAAVQPAPLTDSTTPTTGNSGTMRATTEDGTGQGRPTPRLDDGSQDTGGSLPNGSSLPIDADVARSSYQSVSGRYIAAAPPAGPLDVPADTGPNGEPVYRQPLQPDCGDCAVLEDGPRERHIERDHPVALDAAQPAPLDVERLAVALHRWRAIFVDPADPEAWYMKSAAAIAREYAALASEDAP